MRFCINGVSFELEAGLPISCPWQVTDAHGKEYVYEASSVYFPVPKGAYRYKTRVNSPARKQVRIGCGGTRPFTVMVNGEVVYECDGSFYVPNFHRDNSWTTVSLKRGPVNEVEVIFPEHEEGEFFFGIGTTFGCAVLLDTMERIL